MIQNQKRERRDWTLLIFIIPLGIILIIIVGQIAIRLSPIWSVNAGMNSNLEPDPNAAQPLAILQPILPQILTPMAWMENYLTPGAAIYFPPFMTLEPTATPSPTEVTPTATESTPTQVTATGTPVPTNTASATTPPPSATEDPEGGSSTPPPICNDPAANNQSDPLPCTYDPATCDDPAANNQGDPLPCTYDPICPGAHNPDGPLPCDYGDITTIDPNYGMPVPVPSEIGVGTLPDNNPSGPAGNGIGTIVKGTYIVISFSITVQTTPDANYDLAYYEYDSGNGGAVYLDWIIIGITKDPTGSTYYEVFNWGSNSPPDTNSNVDYTGLPADPGCPSNNECDNREILIAGNTEIQPSENILYDPDYDPGNPPTTPETNGPAPQTGILIDVDTADSRPPPDTYKYIVIINPSDGGDDTQVDAIQTVEVPIPP